MMQRPSTWGVGAVVNMATAASLFMIHEQWMEIPFVLTVAAAMVSVVIMIGMWADNR